MLEKHFASQLEDLLRLTGWRFQHQRPAQYIDGRYATHFTGDQGFPDYVAVRGDRLIFTELKTDTGRATTAQLTWLSDLQSARTIEVYLWRPSDLNQIGKILAR